MVEKTNFNFGDGGQLLQQIAKPLALLGVLITAELAAISLGYNHAFEFNCRAQAPAFFCGFLSLAVIRAISIIGALSLFLMARPNVLQVLFIEGRKTLDMRWIGAHLIGMVMVFLPWLFLDDQAGQTGVTFAAVLWVLGGFLAAIGAALALVPWARWRALYSNAGVTIIGILLLAGLLPELAAMFQKVWQFDLLTEATFRSAEGFLSALGYEVVVDARTKLLGIKEFQVLVGRQCSGVEGFLLISSFLAFYIWLFREDLRFPRIWLLLPIGIALSWIFNVVRISLLILVGHHVSPDLAVNGFHSHAGWLMFTILAVGTAISVHRVNWFKKDADSARIATNSRAKLPLRLDPSAAQILPFIGFMATALLFSTFTETPGVYYPIRFAVMLAVLMVFVQYYNGLDWSVDVVVIGVGILIGVAWVMTAPAGGEDDKALVTALEAMSGGMFVLWVVTRILGTSLLVPVIEELFFRGYVLRSIDTGGMPARILAFVISAGLFAVLHQRWLAAFIAGIIFGVLMLRKGKVTDAIWAHAAANAVIAGWAIATRDWSVI